MKIFTFSRIIFLVGLSLIVVWGCSSNQPQVNTEGTESTDGGQSEIDQLFGINDENENAKKSQDEDEVLQLLGIQKEQGAANSVDSTTNDDALRSEIMQLEQRLSDKDSEISNLKSQIATKDEKITQLETTEYSKPATSEKSAYAATGNFKQDYQNALSEYDNRNYKAAIQMFKDLLAQDANNSLSDNCRYWIGESYYGLGDYNQAIIEFTKVFSFANSNKADAAQLKLGLCYLRLGDQARARQEFERLVSDYPQSEFISKAQEYIAKL
ncbi:MAG: tetratricopeptide repeat protein [Candidatus Zhuqueibacterota bacterium]